MWRQILYLSLQLVLVGRVKPRNEIAEDGNLDESARRRPSVVYTFLRFTASLGSVTDILNYNWDCAYTNESPVVVEDLYVDKLRAIAQEAVGLNRVGRVHSFGINNHAYAYLALANIHK